MDDVITHARATVADARVCLHGTDERVGADELAGAVGFYRELIRRAQQDL